MEYTVETSYSGGTFWTYYATCPNLSGARSMCSMLTATSQGNFKARIVRKEVIE